MVNKMKVSLLLVCLVIIGCAPSKQGWVWEKNYLIGKDFNEQVIAPATFWSPVNEDKMFEDIVQEGDAKRYFITWIRTCKYSLLVDSAGVIKSWRYEVADKKDCYVF